VIEKLPSGETGLSICLIAALIKFDRFEWLVEKATELGVEAIQPFEAVRTGRGLATAAVKRRPRWEKITLEASQQARRVHLPRVLAALPFAQALKVEANVRVLLDESADAPPILHSLPRERITTDRVALLLGPEGGWTNEERAQAMAAGYKSCSLGRTVLRSETAAVAGLAAIQVAWAA
jgi:16S rRNA (uracil1498-N3)-methyltransferase